MKIQLLFVLILLSGSCTYHNEEEFEVRDCNQIPSTFSEHVMPIIQQNCAVSGCHISGTGLPDFMDFSNIQQRAAEIKFRTQNRIMPPPSSGRTLSVEDINTIACWVESGAHNN